MAAGIWCRELIRTSLQVAVTGAVLCLAVPACAGDPDLLADVTNCLVKPRQVIQLGSPVFGIIGEMLVDRGSVVTQGEVVARLESSVEQAQVAVDRQRATNTTAIESAKVDLGWYQRELERRQKLAGNMFSKANDIDEYVTKAEQARIAIRRAEAEKRTAELEAERSQRQLELRSIRSPVNGVVTDIKLRPGEFIYEQNPMMVIAQTDPLSIDLVVPAGRYQSVSVGKTAVIRFNSPVDTEVTATIDAIDPVIDAASDTFRVRLAAPNPDNRIPAGVRCSARLSEVAPAPK